MTVTLDERRQAVYEGRPHSRSGRSMPDHDAIVDQAIVGTNRNTPIIVPSDWPGFGADVHFHAPADSTRPDGWLMPPMQPTDGAPPPYFFDGSSGAYPFDLFGFGFGREDPTGYLDRLGVAMSAINAVSKVLSTMPVYGIRDEVHEFVLPSWRINPQPDTYESWIDFFAQLVVSVLTRGEAVVWAVSRFADGYPSQFVVLDHRRVAISTDGSGRRVYRLGKRVLDPADVLHLRYAAVPGHLHGIGPLEWMARCIVGAEVLGDYVDRVARYGVPAILESPRDLNAGQARDLKDKFMSTRRPGEPAVLSGGLAYRDGGGGLSPESMAAVDLMTMNEQKIIAAIASTPPVVAGVPHPASSYSYTSLHQMTATWWRTGLRPLAQQLMASMSNWLLPHGSRMELNRDEFVRSADPVQVAQYYSTMHSIRDADGRPAISTNEIRVAERLPPWPPPTTQQLDPDKSTPTDLSQLSATAGITGGQSA